MLDYHKAVGTLPHAPGLLTEFPVPTPAKAGPGQAIVKTAFVGMTPMAVWMVGRPSSAVSLDAFEGK
jgi:hypothetical protein